MTEFCWEGKCVDQKQLESIAVTIFVTVLLMAVIIGFGLLLYCSVKKQQKKQVLQRRYSHSHGGYDYYDISQSELETKMVIKQNTGRGYLFGNRERIARAPGDQRYLASPIFEQKSQENYNTYEDPVRSQLGMSGRNYTREKSGKSNIQ